MSVPLETFHERFAVPPDMIRRLSVTQYHDMIRAGILTTDDRVELLDGWLAVKMTQNPPHRMAVKLVHDALARILPQRWYADSQAPITLSTSEPEPDVAVIRGDTRQYADRHPGPEEVAIVVEVADSTLEQDRTWKKAVYAEAGVAVYWIVNLLDRRVEVYSDPSGPVRLPDYRRRQDYRVDEAVPVVLDGREVGRIPARELMP